MVLSIGDPAGVKRGAMVARLLSIGDPAGVKRGAVAALLLSIGDPSNRAVPPLLD